LCDANASRIRGDSPNPCEFKRFGTPGALTWINDSNLSGRSIEPSRAANEEEPMPHRAKAKPAHKGGHKKQQTAIASETMAQEFPSYEALDEQPSGSLRGEHRADTSRMGRRGSGGVDAKRSPDEDDMPARGEGRSLDDSDDLPARGESVGSTGSIWDEGETPARGESRGRSAGDLTWSGFAKPSRGESSGEETSATGRADRSGAASRGESDGGSSGRH
jgi:hypothetical protein